MDMKLGQMLPLGKLKRRGSGDIWLLLYATFSFFNSHLDGPFQVHILSLIRRRHLLTRSIPTPGG
jgi:hypothetical protein